MVLIDIIVIHWDLGVARQVIVAGFPSMLVLYLANYLTTVTPNQLPGFEWKHEVYGLSVRIAIASPITYLIAELVNAQLTRIYRRIRWARTLYSNPIALTMDTQIFIPVAFYSEAPLEVLLDMIIGLTSLKLSFIPLNITAIHMTRKS